MINHSDHNAWRRKQHHLLVGHDDLPLLIQAVVVTPLNHIGTVGECAGGDVYQFAGSAVLQLEEAAARINQLPMLAGPTPSDHCSMTVPSVVVPFSGPRINPLLVFLSL